jgi:4-hydroxy 2-oxovalerate aldolase
MDKLLFFDSTLRDGSHAVAHKISANTVREYCRVAYNSGLYTIIVGHGNGLGASSLQVGISDEPDQDMITTARSELKESKLGAFLLPGFGTITDDLGPALDNGVDLVCIGCHCTEADITRQHIQYVRKREKEAYGVLMMYHMATPQRLLEEALKMQDYGAHGVILMDSAGSSLPDMVSERVKKLADNLDIHVGFHAHNNLGLAIANSYTAIKSGATIIDGTIRGFGAGAGNCQLEVLAGLLSKLEIETSLDLYKLMDMSEGIVSKLTSQGISSISLTSGLAGVFSGFAPHVKKAAIRFGVDPRDIFMELGRRKMVAGQEDFIVDVALELANKKARDQDLSF